MYGEVKHLCVCVCVCERERERERENTKHEDTQYSKALNSTVLTVLTHYPTYAITPL